LSIIIAETKTGEVRAYLGSHAFFDSLNAGQVDGIQAYRSTGSLLKPFLIAGILDRGPYTMLSKVQDIPTYYGTFIPQNASCSFNGLASLEKILIESLNVPSVRLLNTFGIQDFYSFLKDAHFKGLFRKPEDYGLSMILGGAEASLAELTTLYLILGNLGVDKNLKYKKDNPKRIEVQQSGNLFSAGAAWLVLNTLNAVSRPGIEYYWNFFNNQVPVAWKTGTSYGQKDGWAIGVNNQWTIGVWTGNFNGRGNAALTGSRSAAPILFDLFNSLTYDEGSIWFSEPEYDLIEVECCLESGFPANPSCPLTKKNKRPITAHMPGICPYHRRFAIEKHSKKSVCSLCWDDEDVAWETRYIVPAGVRDILTRQGYTMDAIPYHYDQCPSIDQKNRLEITYPANGIKIVIPRDLDGKFQRIVFAAKHHQPKTQLFWYLNGDLVGNTTGKHILAVNLNAGSFRLTVQDEEGFSETVFFSAYKNDT
jgi:penicillin-binding protein 1C